ncbi:MAG: hypothetical protein K2Q20_03505 [Phycisphaerales bacterium]|nr:hypothetical protein [Phycisphaerales bacterium]
MLSGPFNARLSPPAGRGRPTPRGARRSRSAFTLLEAALATVIIGVGVLALVEAQWAFLRSNAWSSQAASASYMANEIRELMRGLPKHDPVNGLEFVTSGGTTTLQGWGPRASDVTVRDFNHIDAFDGLIFRPAGTAGWADGDLPGPVDAFGTVIPDVDGAGNVRTLANGNAMPLQGWSQQVVVQKINPFNNSITYPPAAVLAPDAATGFRGLGVDEFPLRVTVIVRYQGPFDSVPVEMVRLSWIVQ